MSDKKTLDEMISETEASYMKWKYMNREQSIEEGKTKDEISHLAEYFEGKRDGLIEAKYALN